MAKQPALKSVGATSFNVKDFLEKLDAYAKAYPPLAPRAYANGAMHLRAQSQKCAPRDRLVLQTFAVRLEELAARALIPAVDPEYNEEMRTWADYPGDDSGPGVVTEYDGMVADIAASKINERGEPNNELVAADTFQKLQQAREAALVQPVQINPASARQGVTLFGSQALIQAGGSNSTTGSFVGTNGSSGAVVAADRARIINWEGRENETRVLTVAIAPVASGAGATYPAAQVGGTNASYRPYFRALFGASGQGQAIEVFGDVGQGIQFTLACAFLTVSVGMDPAQANYTPGSMLVSGQMGFFARHTTSPVMRTRYFDSLATGGANKSTNNLVPKLATGLLPIQTSEINTGSCQIDWKDAAGTILYSSQLLTPGSQVSPIPIGDDVYQYDITNTGSGTANFRLMFQLAL